MKKRRTDEQMQMMGADRGAAMKAEAEAEIAAASPPGFDFTSLGAWLDAVKRAHVPHVPAELVASIPKVALQHFDDVPGELQDESKAFWTKIDRAKEDGYMLRWDWCAPSEVKGRMANGAYAWAPQMVDHFTIDDPRAYDMMGDTPGDIAHVWKRPWVQALILEGYPVEFRVFVRANEIAGISSYYPQRPIPSDFTHLDAILEQIRSDTRAIMRHIKLPLWSYVLGEVPYFDLRRLHCTMDFMVTRSGILFLEGGPPHTPDWGAHPCCFRPGEVAGVALSDQNE